MPTAIDPWAVAAGLIAYGLSVLAATLLIFATYRANAWLSRRLDVEGRLLSGHRSLAIVLGSVLLSQAFLLRHALFPTMVTVRDLLLHPVTPALTATTLLRCSLFFVVIGVLSMGSVALAVRFFTWLTGSLPEREEILRDNQAVAILFAFVLFSITVVINEGMEDLARSLIPFGRSGIVRIE